MGLDANLHKGDIMLRVEENGWWRIVLTKREIGGALLTLLIQFYFSAHFEYIKEIFFIRRTTIWK